MAKKITRAVIIGLGGTGQNVIMGVKKRFYERYNVLPESVQFINFDTTRPTDAVDEYKYPYGLEEKTAKIHIDDDFQYLQTVNLRNSFENNKNVKEFAPDHLPKIAEGLISGAGANGKRMVGRMISFTNINKIRNRIGQKIDYLTANLGALNEKLKEQGFEQIDTKADQNILIFITGSWSGGTGSGILWDVLGYLGELKENNGKPIKTFGFYFMPDFYEDFPYTDNANANAYGAFLELDHIFDPDVRADDELNFEVGGHRFKENPLDVVNVIQKDCGRFSLKNASEAYDSVATAIANLSTSIGQAALDAIVNTGQKDYIMAGKYRNYSSIGVSEIKMDRTKILDYGVGKLLIPKLEEYLNFGQLEDIRQAANKFIINNKLDEGEDKAEADSKNDLIDTLIPPDKSADLAEFPEFEIRGEILPVVEDACTSYVSELNSSIDKRLDGFKIQAILQKIRIEINNLLLMNKGGITKAETFANSLLSSFGLMNSLLREEVKRHTVERQKLEEEAEDHMRSLEGVKVGLMNKKKTASIVNEVKRIYQEVGKDSIRWQIVQKRRKDKAIEIFVSLNQLLKEELSRIEELAKAIKICISEIDAYNRNYDPKLSDGREIRLGYFLKEMIDTDPYLIIKTESDSNNIPTLELDIANVFVEETQIEGIQNRLLKTLRNKLSIVANEGSLANSLLNINYPIDNIIKSFLSEKQQKEMWIALNNVFDTFWNYNGMDLPADGGDQKDTEHIFITGTCDGEERNSYITSKNIMKLSIAENLQPGNLNIVATNNPNLITLFTYESAIPGKNLNASNKYKSEFLMRSSNGKNFFFSDKRFDGRVADLFDSRGASRDEIREAWLKGCVLGKIQNKAKSYYIDYAGKKKLHNTGQARKRNDRAKTFEFFATNKEFINEMNSIWDSELKENKSNICNQITDYYKDKMYTIQNIGKQKGTLSDAEKELIQNEKMIALKLGIYSYGMNKEDFYDNSEKNKAEVDSLVRAIEREN